MRVLVTGSTGMLGRSLLTFLNPSREVIAPPRSVVDLTECGQVSNYLSVQKPDIVIHLAARVGGIKANIDRPHSFLQENLLIDANVISSAAKLGVPKLLYVGSSCMYPKDISGPITEAHLLDGPLEPTNEGYALAKIVGHKLCTTVNEQFGLAYKTVVPSNLYGPNDNFDLATAHLVAAVIVKMHAAKINCQDKVSVWGSGEARREFTYVDDLARWMSAAVNRIDELPEILNVGSGSDLSIIDYYKIAMEVVGYFPNLELDTSKPDGMKNKLMDSSKAALHYGWKPQTEIKEGMKLAYSDYLANHAH